ncbi:hypothetical protein [Desertivirga arenae]
MIISTLMYLSSKIEWNKPLTLENLNPEIQG